MTAKVDLSGDKAIEISSNYEVILRLCNAPDLTLYDAYSQIYSTDGLIIPFRTEVLSTDTFRLYLNWDDFTDQIAGIYEYDVLFVNKLANPSYRFYPVIGVAELVTRLSEVM